MKNSYCCVQPNYLLSWTEIGVISGTISVLALVIASTGFVNFKSGIFIQSNTSGNRKTRIPYTSVDSGEQYKFIGGK